MGQLQIAQALPPLTSAEPVYCQECRGWFEPDRTWRCPGCEAMAAFAVQPGYCPTCFEPANDVRLGHELRTLCRCVLAPAKRAEVEARWAEMDREDQEIADQLAGVRKPRPTPAGPPRLPDDAPLRDWWPDLLELMPRHLATGPILDHVEGHREDFPLQHIVDCLRRVLERIQRKGTEVGAPSYITAALSRELGSASRERT